jgi:chemotaxis signal transduction protein
MPLRVYSTLTREKEEFQTIEPGKVSMYLCGPTVYKPAHIGHMVGPVIFDTVKRYLTYLRYKVTFVINITDDAVQPTPDVACDTVKAFVRGLFAIEGRMISLISLDRVLPELEAEAA